MIIEIEIFRQIPESYFDQFGFEDKFPEEELQLFKEAFTFFDREGDGTMASEGDQLLMKVINIISTIETWDLLLDL